MRQSFVGRIRESVFFAGSSERNCNGGDGQGEEYDGDYGGGVEDLIVGGVAGVVEEEVVLDAHVGDDGHCDLDVAAFVGGGEDVEGGEGEAESGSGDGGDCELEAGLGWG